MLRIIALLELEDGALRLLRQPHYRAQLERLRPVHLVQQPRRGDAREVRTSRAVDIEGRLRVPLQERGGNLEVDLALDRALDDARLVLAGGEQRDLARVEDGGHA